MEKMFQNDYIKENDLLRKHNESLMKVCKKNEKLLFTVINALKDLVFEIRNSENTSIDTYEAEQAIHNAQ